MKALHKKVFDKQRGKKKKCLDGTKNNVPLVDSICTTDIQEHLTEGVSLVEMANEPVRLGYPNLFPLVMTNLRFAAFCACRNFTES